MQIQWDGFGPPRAAIRHQSLLTRASRFTPRPPSRAEREHLGGAGDGLRRFVPCARLPARAKPSGPSSARTSFIASDGRPVSITRTIVLPSRSSSERIRSSSSFTLLFKAFGYHNHLFRPSHPGSGHTGTWLRGPPTISSDESQFRIPLLHRYCGTRLPFHHALGRSRLPCKGSEYDHQVQKCPLSHPLPNGRTS